MEKFLGTGKEYLRKKFQDQSKLRIKHFNFEFQKQINNFNNLTPT